MLASFLRSTFVGKVFVRKRLSSLPKSSRWFGEKRNCSIHTIALFAVTVTVSHPESYGTPLLFRPAPWIMECCHSWLALNHLPLVFYFEGGFIGFLSRLCVENDLELEPTSAVKIKIDTTSAGLTQDKWHFFFLLARLILRNSITRLAVT